MALFDLLEEGTDLARFEPTVTAERADRGDLPGSRPARHGFGVDAEHRGNFRRREEGIVVASIRLVHRGSLTLSPSGWPSRGGGFPETGSRHRSGNDDG